MKCDWCGDIIYGEYLKDGDYVFCSQKCRREWQNSEREKEERKVKDAGFSSAAEMDAFNRGVITPRLAQIRNVIAPEPETEPDPVIQCVHCGAQVPEDSKFCSNCGKTPYPACPQCGAKISGDPRFCNSCGNDLKKLIIPAGTTVIEDEAYKGKGLFDVVIPEGVTSIGKNAFDDNKLTSVTLPEGLTSIGDSAFIGDMLFHGSNQLTSVTLPEGLTSIGDHAFYANQLTSVTLPEGLTSIGDYAFSDNKLTSVKLPESLITIGDSAFGNTLFHGNQLTSVTLPANLTSIGDSAFFMNKLTSVTLPEGLTSIGDHAFYANQLTSVTLPEGLTSIGDGAFSDNQLTSVKLPESLTSIGANAFSSNQLTSVTLPANLAFDKDCFGEFGGSFLDCYTKNGKKADTYTYNAGTGGWSAESVNREIAACGEEIRQNPGDPAMYVKRGNIYYNQKNYDLAAADYTEAIRLKPDDAGFFACRANTWFCKNDWDKAIPDYSEAIRLKPDDAASFYYRGTVYTFQKNREKAYADFEETRRINPQFADVHGVTFCDNAVQSRDKGEYDKALELYASTWHLCSSERMPALLSGRGWTYYLKGDYEKALADLDKSLRLEPGNPDREKRRNEIQAKINEKAAGAVRPQAKGLAGLFRKK
jgi:lipoprotein NlpI